MLLALSSSMTRVETDVPPPLSAANAPKYLNRFYTRHAEAVNGMFSNKMAPIPTAAAVQAFVKSIKNDMFGGRGEGC
jgi:hypothetical protein